MVTLVRETKCRWLAREKKKPYSAVAFYVMGNANLFALLLLFFLGKRYEAPLKKEKKNFLDFRRFCLHAT